MRPLARIALAAAVLVGVAAACGDGDAPTGPPLEPDIDVILQASAATMGEVETVRFAIDRGGAPIFIDIGFDRDGLEFIAAEGRFAAPSTADALVTGAIGDLTTEIGAVAVDGQTWL